MSGLEPRIIRGPNFDGCTSYCHHIKVSGSMGIYWQDVNGEEWGQAIAMQLVDGDLTNAQIQTATVALWNQYDRWVASEIESDTDSTVRGRLDSAR